LTEQFTIIGAGMAGLLAAAVLREECAAILEAQSELPNNHAALLRFRSPVVGDALNIPFRAVQVIKSVDSIGNPIADAVSYSLKTNGRALLRSLVTATNTPETRYIAPMDFTERLRRKVTAPITFGQKWDGQTNGPTISTLPMPTLMGMLGYEHNVKFEAVTGFVISARLRDCDLYATIYLPSSDELAYRASITGDRLIIEYAFPRLSAEEAAAKMQPLRESPMSTVSRMLPLFGMPFDQIAEPPTLKLQRYAKILPVPDDVRKRFMLWATEHHSIYSLGRFATWRPGLLMDDLIHDLHIIQKMVRSGTRYDAQKGR